MSGQQLELSDGYVLTNVSNPQFPNSLQWDFIDPLGEKVGYIALYVQGSDSMSVAIIMLGVAGRGKGLGTQAVKALKAHYGCSISSDPQGNTSADAIKMWQRLGAKKMPTEKNTKGYYYVLEGLLREYLRFLIKEGLAGSQPEEGYQVATSKNLELNEPGTIVEPDVRQKVGAYLGKMGLMAGKPPKHPKGPKRKTRLG